MTYRGHLKNGAVLLDEPAHLPEGSPVEVTPLPATSGVGEAAAGPTLYETLKDFVGVIKDFGRISPATIAE